MTWHFELGSAGRRPQVQGCLVRGERSVDIDLCATQATRTPTVQQTNRQAFKKDDLTSQVDSPLTLDTRISAAPFLFK